MTNNQKYIYLIETILIKTVRSENFDLYNCMNWVVEKPKKKKVIF